jgi:hypothetical protein
LHVGAEDSVDAGLVAGVLAEPAEQVGVEAHCHDLFGDRHDEFCVLPEGFIGGVDAGVGEDAAADIGWRLAAQPFPVCAGCAPGRTVRFRGFANSGGARAARSAMLR